MVEESGEKRTKKSDWDLESSFDMAAGLEDLINSPPFKEASDEKGESVTSGTRLPLWLHRRIVKIKELPGSPYEVNSDVLRDAAYLGLQILHMRYSLMPEWSVERKMAAAVDASSALKRLRDQVDMLATGVEELFESGDTDQAAQRLSDYVLAAGELENKWHRDRVFRLLSGNKIVREIAQFCPPDVQKIIKGGGNAKPKGS